MFGFLSSADASFSSSIKKLIGAKPKVLNHYHQAFRHSSLSAESNENNERLEFLGDSVLNLLVAEHLYHTFPWKKEGYLSDIRSKMVSRNLLNTIAQKMGLQHFLKFNKQNEFSLTQTAMMGNALEALVGAVYLDLGFDGAKKFVHDKIIYPHLDVKQVEVKEFNYKSKLLEWGQKDGKEIKFKLLKEFEDEAHIKIFRVGVFVEGKKQAEAEDRNKKNAEKKAAQLTFERLHIHLTQ